MPDYQNTALFSEMKPAGGNRNVGEPWPSLQIFVTQTVFVRLRSPGELVPGLVWYALAAKKLQIGRQIALQQQHMFAAPYIDLGRSVERAESDRR